MASASDSALLSLVDHGDDEIQNSQLDFNQGNNETYVGMENDTDQLLGDDIETVEDNGKRESPFTFAFYTKLFDVDTDEIVSRLIWSACPRPSYTSSFARKKIKSKPDLYGPFWIGVTLVFSVAIAGNVASYFQYQIDKDSSKHWHYNFHKVTVSAAIVFLYATLVPSGVFAMLWSGTPKDSTSKPAFMELVCIFGYSLTPFVPISILWLIQISLVQWILVLVSFFLSGGVLLLALWPIVNEFSAVKTKGYTIIAVVLGLHLLLASGFMLCFFHVPSAQPINVNDSTTPKANQESPMKPDIKLANEKNNKTADSTHEKKRDTVKAESMKIPDITTISKKDHREQKNVITQESSRNESSEKALNVDTSLNNTKNP